MAHCLLPRLVVAHLASQASPAAVRNRALPHRSSVALSIVVMALLAGVAGAATKTVQVGPGGSLTFSPGTVTVGVGDTVEWRWMSGTHTTTRMNGPESWDSGVASAPHTFSHTFTQVGTFAYVCTIHAALGMTGKVIVNGMGATTTTTVTSTTAVGLPCDGLQACSAALMAALPAASSTGTGKVRRIDHLVRHLAGRAIRQLDHAAVASGKRRTHIVNQSRRTLERLRKVADAAAAKGILDVPVGPVDAAVASLLNLDH